MANDATSKLGEIVGGIFGDVFGHPVIRLLVSAFAAYMVILWIATAWWAYQDMRRRNADPTAPYLAAGLVIVSTPLLFPLALLVYAVARPGRTLAECRLLQLEAQLDELDQDSGTTCPACRRAVEPDWLSCPSCRSRLAYRCLTCDKSVGLDWTLCAWCGAEFGGRRAIPAGTRAGLAERRRAGLRPMPGGATMVRRSLPLRSRVAEGRISAET